MAWISIDDSRWIEVVHEDHAYQSSEQKFYGLQLGDQLRGCWALQRVQRLASERAVAIFSISSCCMCHVAKRLLLELGVSPTVYELDQENGGEEMHKALLRVMGTAQSVPAVFIGGKLVGGLEQLMTCHIGGSLVPLLKEAGALWL
ncbi:hypothetical protein SUGI_0221400 [Cryptomeria japonica]|uniref:glutaredoxin-C1-like n=1 Tax=Cryptomeria japonica TaxID=3369 RepID=UPI002408E4A6|nr:glutaredoxin-C1-like [Cryptomeria japonica]GLJ13856.1 hypothetical protein SUGI_0221400 [Cryptomeria japonica]